MPRAAADLSSLAQQLRHAGHGMVFTGAGISAESGVPTFRDIQTGYWAQFRPEDMASEPGFRADPERVWRWYAYRRALVAAVQPNAAHRALAAFADSAPVRGARFTLATQNVDGLHRQAGSPQVLALHGELCANRWLDAPCVHCDLAQALAQAGEGVPRCPHCGNCVRPGVVWFGEMLPAEVLDAAEQAAQRCDWMLVVGTAGVVYPAAGLVHTAKAAGARVLVLNTAPSALDALADEVLRGPAAQLLPQLLAA